MISIVQKSKEITSNIIYKLQDYYSSFTYIFRKRYYRLRLISRFYKHPYYGAWELVNPLLEYSFDILCEFYEHNTDTSEETYFNDGTYNEMTRLYNWWTVEREQRHDELDYLLEVWSEHHVTWFEEDTEGEYKGWFVYKTSTTPYANHVHNLYLDYGTLLDKQDEDNLISLIKLRGRLWS